MTNSKSRTWHQTKDFLKLRKHWYDKAKESGFEDQEIIDWRTGESGNLMRGGVNIDKLYAAHGLSVELQQEYYYRATHHLQLLKDEDEVDERWLEAWRLHTEGESMRGIARKLHMRRDNLSDFIWQQSARFWEPAAVELKKRNGAPASPEQGPIPGSSERNVDDSSNIVDLASERKNTWKKLKK